MLHFHRNLLKFGFSLKLQDENSFHLFFTVSVCVGVLVLYASKEIVLNFFLHYPESFSERPGTLDVQ